MINLENTIKCKGSCLLWSSYRLEQQEKGKRLTGARSPGVYPTKVNISLQFVDVVVPVPSSGVVQRWCWGLWKHWHFPFSLQMSKVYREREGGTTICLSFIFILPPRTLSVMLNSFGVEELLWQHNAILECWPACFPARPPACCCCNRGKQSGEPLWKRTANLSSPNKWWSSAGSGWAINVEENSQSMRYWVSELLVFCFILFCFGMVCL